MRIPAFCHKSARKKILRKKAFLVRGCATSKRGDLPPLGLGNGPKRAFSAFLHGGSCANRPEKRELKHNRHCHSMMKQGRNEGLEPQNNQFYSPTCPNASSLPPLSCFSPLREGRAGYFDGLTWELEEVSRCDSGNATVPSSIFAVALTPPTQPTS